MTTFTKAAPKPKRSKTKASKSACVRLSSKIVTHGGKCCTCKNTKLNSEIYPSHIVPRNHDSTVARTDNQLPQCSWCATVYTDNPKLWEQFVDEKFPGRRQMLLSVARSQVGVKVDWAVVLADLKEQAAIAGVE